MTIFTEISELKAREDFEAAWQQGLLALEKECENTYLKTTLFWVIYAALKKVTEPIKTREIKTPRPQEQRVIDEWASRISMLKLTLPNEVIDFRLWNVFRGIGKFCEPICLFLLDSGSAIFNQGDYTPFVTEKGESPSTVVRLARMTAGNFLLNPPRSRLSAPRIIAFINYAIHKAEDSADGKVWLEYDKARVYLAAGEIEKARNAYLAVLRKKRIEAWAWFGFANTYEREPEISLCLVAEGLLHAHDPKYSVAGLLKLAELLALQAEYVYASKALIRLNELYLANGWALNDKAIELMSSSWFDGSLDSAALNERIRELASNANQYAVTNPVIHLGVVLSNHSSKKGAEIFVNKELSLSARKGVFKGGRLLKTGAFVKILCESAGDKPEVVSIEEVASFKADDICHFEGTLKINEKGFGFVDNFFVPPALIEGHAQNSHVTGLAVMAFDKTKQRHNWRAVAIAESRKDVSR